MVGKVRDLVINLHLLLAAGAVEISESNSESCPSVLEHHLDAVGVKNVAAAGQPDAGLLS